MKKVLVIGGTGYIGSHVVLELMRSGYSPVVLDDLSAGSKRNLFPENEFIEGSFLNSETIDRIPEGVETVIHLAALKAAGESMVQPEKYSDHNIAGFAALLEGLHQKSIKNMVFSSSAAVYGEPKYLPVDEKHPTHPINFYGFTKLFGEQLLEWYSQLKGFRFVSLRYFNAVGYDREKTDFAPENKPNNLFPILMEAAFGIRPSIEIFGEDYNTPDGTCTRDYIHVSDLAKAHVLSVKALQEGEDNLILNLSTGNEISVKEAVMKTLELFNPDIPVKFSPRRPGDPDRLFAKSEKAREKLGWKAKITDLEEILKSMHAIYANQK